MNRKKINKLIAISYKDDRLDPGKVNKIAQLISKTDLKKYINGLKLTEMRRNLIVSSPIDSQSLKKFQSLFPHKKIIFKKDPSLILGVQLTDNDIVYELTLKNSLEKILRHIEQSYD